MSSASARGTLQNPWWIPGESMVNPWWIHWNKTEKYQEHVYNPATKRIRIAAHKLHTNTPKSEAVSERGTTSVKGSFLGFTIARDDVSHHFHATTQKKVSIAACDIGLCLVYIKVLEKWGIPHTAAYPKSAGWSWLIIISNQSKPFLPEEPSFLMARHSWVSRHCALKTAPNAPLPNFCRLL